eukprot:TRINITY_DN12767_c0_g1_i2.p1 TRINITY_DN12767_c0_g1~~TRINITY_DN12767_c0_g1_i2.p1  ORF type:complete len:203 (-),score=25.45 TRINITY_DN12767_c0_g1_i2:180-719(-)
MVSVPSARILCLPVSIGAALIFIGAWQVSIVKAPGRCTVPQGASCVKQESTYVISDSDVAFEGKGISATCTWESTCSQNGCTQEKVPCKGGEAVAEESKVEPWDCLFTSDGLMGTTVCAKESETDATNFRPMNLGIIFLVSGTLVCLAAAACSYVTRMKERAEEDSVNVAVTTAIKCSP